MVKLSVTHVKSDLALIGGLSFILIVTLEIKAKLKNFKKEPLSE